MPTLTEASRMQIRVVKVIVAVDLTNSTAMKERVPETAWLATYDWFFTLLGELATKLKGKIVKYMGDGVMAVFDQDAAAEAINWAIRVQEDILEAQEAMRVDCNCAIGISCGEVVEFATPEGAMDYIGTIADKAFRLCSAAMARAIFVDTDTAANAAIACQ